jgi:hypothetical protein
MKKILFSFQLILFSVVLLAQQNLVPNPSFEEYSICPEWPDHAFRAIGWSAYNDSPDYFNRCTPIYTPLSVSVPYNFVGKQEPASGDAYMGIITFSGDETREHLGAKLNSPLIKGTKYFVSFKTCSAFGGDWNIFSASNKIGVKFSTISHTLSEPSPINNFAHAYTNNIIKDTLNWTTVFGSFIADSAYQFIMLGNFFDNDNTDTIRFIPSNGHYAYYFLDDVCVSTDSTFVANFGNVGISKNEKSFFNIYPNPIRKEFFISGAEEIEKIELVNNHGKKVYVEKIIHLNPNKINLPSLPDGFYILQIKTKHKTVIQKIIISNP